MADPGQIGYFFDSGGYHLLGTLFLARGNDPKPTAVLLHGMPGIEKNYDLALLLREQGWNSLIFHYRGSWGSAGVFSFDTIPVDVTRALDELVGGKYAQVDSQRIILIGHSLGGWAAVLTAAEDTRVQAVIAIASIANPSEMKITIEDAAEGYCPWLPGLTPSSFVQQWESLDEVYYPVEKVDDIAPRPLLIIHGGEDEIVAVSQSETLFARARKPKELLIHPEASHSFVWHRHWLQQTILSWLTRIKL